MSPTGKLHYVLIETFSHSSCCTDWFRPISHRSGNYCIVTRLNHRPPLDKAGIINLIPATYFASQSAIENFQLYLPLLIFSKLGGVQPQFSHVLIRNIESMQITQLIVDNIKITAELNKKYNYI